MKTVTTKEFQIKTAAILKDVRSTGQEYQITFRRRPIVKIIPIS